MIILAQVRYVLPKYFLGVRFEFGLLYSSMVQSNLTGLEICFVISWMYEF